MQTQSNINVNLVAKCGLYCGNCGKFKNGKCAGCEANTKATWCKARTCCIEKGFATCADCTISSPRECKKISNFVSDIFSTNEPYRPSQRHIDPASEQAGSESTGNCRPL